MEILQKLTGSLVGGIGPFFILLGLLIFVHELGHFLVAKFFGVRVEVFSLGFGKKILKYQRGDTTYCVSMIPLGGYVKMFGDDPTAEVSQADAPHSFLKKPVWQRIWIVLAGPLMNLFFAFFLYLLIAGLGEPVSPALIGDVSQGTRAYDAGFRSGDRILSINDQTVGKWKDANELIQSNVGQRLTFVVERALSTERARLEVTPTLGENTNILSADRQVGVIEGLDQASMGTLVGITHPDSMAAKSGLQSLDLILSINDRPISYWRDLEVTIQEEAIRGRVPLKLKVQSYKQEPGPEREILLRFAQESDESLAPAHGDSGAMIPYVPSLKELGIESAQTYLRAIKPGSPADSAGLKVGDRLVSVNNSPITDWREVINLVKSYNPDGEPLKLVYRRDGEENSASVVPELTELMDEKGQDERRYTIGIVSGYSQAFPDPIIYRASNALESLSISLTKTKDAIGMIVMGIVRLVQGEVSARNVGGVFSIGKIANQAYDAGLIHFLQIMAIISINLFLLNLLPVPVLDGGHLVFYTLEALRGAPLSLRKMEIAQQVGLVLLMGLMLFALYNDISNWLNSMW